MEDLESPELRLEEGMIVSRKTPIIGGVSVPRAHHQPFRHVQTDTLKVLGWDEENVTVTTIKRGMDELGDRISLPRTYFREAYFNIIEQPAAAAVH